MTHNHPLHRIRSRLLRSSLTALLLVVTSLGWQSAQAPARASAPTIVSLTFDDGHWSHWENAHPILMNAGVRGTFYLNSGQLETPTSCGSWCWHMLWDQAKQMAADGEDMGNHGFDHLDLTTLSTADAQHQVCDDRQNLIDHGFPAPTSFAYPYGSYNASAESIVRGCGFLSARTVGGFAHSVYAETLPPRDAFAVETPVTDNSLGALERAVTDAESHLGGWVVINFHEVCDCSDAPSRVTPATLTSFVSWLKARSGSGTTIETVAQVMAGSPPPPPPPADTTAPAVSLTSPTNNASYRTSAKVPVAASASDAGSGVARVEFFDGSTLLATDTSSPYGFSWAGKKALGSHTLTATATDAAGNSATSSPVTVVIRQ